MMQYALLLLFPLCLQAHLPTEQQTIKHRKQLTANTAPYCTSIPEGGFVYFFNDTLYPFLAKRLNLPKLVTLTNTLLPHLQIPLSREGFTMASTRRSEEESDETNYSAIWVRDASWHYFALAIDNKDDAKKLLTGLLRFYSTLKQQKRFLRVIADPDIADFEKNSDAMMSVPLIRFSRQTLSHHQIDGKNQSWNHLQFDSHGLFLLAVSHAFKYDILTESDLTPEMIKTLTLFPAFFKSTTYWNRKDAGPWEEELMENTSTIGLIAAGLKGYLGLVQRYPKLHQKFITLAQSLQDFPIVAEELSLTHIEKLYQKGLHKVKKQLKLGCEAPDLTGSGNHRRADAALLFLCSSEDSLFYSDPELIQKILDITLGLVGPYGVFRYQVDAYQALNYWIDHNISSAITGPKTNDFKILTRFNKGLMPADQPFTAQWFFDSTFAFIYYRLCELTENQKTRSFYLLHGDMHLKRALGQFTAEGAIAANGDKLPAMELPESINTLFDRNHLYTPMPSPICPLSWSKASMRLALDSALKAHSLP